MQYLLLIYESEAQRQDWSPDQHQELIAEYMAYTKMLHEKGVFRAGDALEPVATATTVRVRRGDTVTTDGPFAETKEQLGGYYVIECDNLDEALDYAAKCPTAKLGSLEVRPVMVWDK